MSWTRFFRRSYWDAERARELDAHLAHEIDDHIARGLTPDEATRAAHLKLGNPTLVREEIYEMNTIGVLESVWHDLRFGLRVLAKSPTFTVVAILTLALGTGANAAIFQLVNAIRFRPLPVEKPDELVSIAIDTHGKPRVGRAYRRGIYTEPLWQEIRRQQQAFSSVLAWGTDDWDLAAEGESHLARGLYVSGGFFDGLGIRPHAGRLIAETDDKPGCGAPGAVLSHGFWQTQYGGDPAILGRSILVQRHRFDIVGVAPRAFFGVEVGRTFDVALPLCAEPLLRGKEQAGTGRRDVAWLDIMGRLKPDWTLERASTHLAAISRSVFEATQPPTYTPEAARNYAAFTLTARPAATGVSELRNTYALELWVLLGATALILLLACANLANVMLARASAREREIAVRLAIGGSRRRIVRQVLSESLLIAALGATGGLVLARWLSAALVAFLTSEHNRIFVPLSPDWRVFAFLALVAVLACVLFGLSPALRATSTDPGQVLHVGGRSATASGQALALRRGLVVVQLALSTVLVIGALLFGRSLQKLHSVDLGFRPDVIAAYVDLQPVRVEPAARDEALAAVMSRLRALPGVRHAAEALIVPLSGTDWNGSVYMGGVAQDGQAHFNLVGGEYFRTLETPLLSGRTFDERDRPEAPKAAIVNESFVKRYLRGVAPLGASFETEAPPGSERPGYQVVGVVKDSKYLEMREEFLPIAYLAISQEQELWPYVGIVIQSDLPLASLSPAMTRAITDAAPGAGITYDTVKQYIDLWVATDRLMASLSGFFGVLALVIAAIGLYGVMSYAVTYRRVEIGIRMALGADPRTVLRMVLTESSVLLVTGVTAGLGLAGLSLRYASGLLYGLPAIDGVSFFTAAGVLAFVSVVAAWIPARRASRLAPMLALRE